MENPDTVKFDEDPIKRISSFWQNKKYEWQKKIVEFKVYIEKPDNKKLKLKDTAAFDMSTVIGGYM